MKRVHPEIISRVREKCTAKPQKVNLYHDTRKKSFYEHRDSEAWFLSYGLLNIKENAQIAPLIFNAGRCTSEQ